MTHELIETFEKNASELYWLAFLLTGNADRSVQAFDRALDFDEDENPAFGDFIRKMGLEAYWDRFGWPSACRREGPQIACH